MRYAVLADIHGNLPALRAVLAQLDGAVDGYLCAGDVVGYGPDPNGCARALAERDVVAVAGNHDLIALGRLSDDRCSDTARTTLRWTADVLAPDVRAWLAGLPAVAERDGITLAHGAPGDPQEYVTGPTRAAELVRGLSNGDGMRALALGHTHRAWAWSPATGTALEQGTGEVDLGAADSWLLNPGSVGQSRERDPRARYAIVDVAQRRARFEAVAYDLRATRTALRAAGLPPSACYSPPSRTGQIRRIAAGARRRWAGGR